MKDHCDTEDLGNDAENSAFHHRNKLHFTIYSNRKVILTCNYISHVHLNEHKRLLSIKKTDPKPLNVSALIVEVHATVQQPSISIYMNVTQRKLSLMIQFLKHTLLY